MFSAKTQILTLIVVAVSVLAFVSLPLGDSDAEDTGTTYQFFLVNSVDGEDSTINGSYTAVGNNPVQALKNALDAASITNTIDATQSSVYFGDKAISNWSSAWNSSDTDCFGANYAVWNYNSEKGWFTGNTFGADSDTVYLISHENYYVPSGETAKALGVTADSEGNYTAPVGYEVTFNYYVQLAPQDPSATPENLVFGPGLFKNYTFILRNSVAGEDSSINGTYTEYGTNAVAALKKALDRASVANTIDASKTSLYFGDKAISDWSSAWNSSDADCFGANYAVWNYNTEKGWFTGNTFGTDPDAVYLISHEYYYVPTGDYAKAVGVTQDAEGNYTAPAGYQVSFGYYMQFAPQDASATPEKLAFGPDAKEYTFILVNSVTGEDSSINATYSSTGINPVQALKFALTDAKIVNTLDGSKASVYFGDKAISDWSFSWKSSDPDCFGANYAVWNYNTEKGWYLGNTFGLDSDTVYLISHENYYTPYGEPATAIGVTQDEEGNYIAPAGLLVNYNYYVQLAPMDLSATPDKLVFSPYYFIIFDTDGGSHVTMVPGHEGDAVSISVTPSKEGYTFLGWASEVPSVMPAHDVTLKAIWQGYDGTVVDLTGNDTFLMPATEKNVVLKLSDTASIRLPTSSGLEGKTIVSNVETVANTSKVSGTAYEIVLTADGAAFNGKMQVTLPYDGSNGVMPNVYYIDGGAATAMSVVSYDRNSVTFETDHNSTYVVSTEEVSEDKDDITVIAAFVVVIIVIAALLLIVADRQKKV